MARDPMERMMMRGVFAGMTFLAALAVAAMCGCAPSHELHDAGHAELSGQKHSPGPEPSTLHIAWCDDPCRTATIQWIEVEPTQRRIDGPAPVLILHETDAAGRAVGSGVVHVSKSRWLSRSAQYLLRRVILTELKPDTKYGFTLREGTVHAVIDDGGQSSVLMTHTFRTAPERVDRTITFAEGGDVGTTWEVTRLHRHAATWDPLFAVIGGDIAYGDGSNPREWIRFFEDWNQYMRGEGGRHVPMVVAIGNHEVRGGFNKDYSSATYFRRLFEPMFGGIDQSPYATLDVGDTISFILLDSQHATRIEGEQTAWLEEQLRQRMGRPHVFPIYHVPAYPAHRDFDSERGDRASIRRSWVPLFEEYGMTCVFEHDDHVYKRTHRLRGGEPAADGVLYVGDGAWGQGGRTAATPEERPYLAKSAARRHVLRVDLMPDGARRIQAVGVDGDVIDAFTQLPDGEVIVDCQNELVR